MTMLSRKMNILLLGETGVGKSTFINMFGNYLSGKTLQQIASRNCNILVPTKFSLMNREDFTEEIIEIGYSEHEIPGTGNSATQRPQTYVFNYPEHNLVLNLIDTPGVGDTRGLLYDKKNTDMVLSYISELESIDAFCILLKPNIVRISVQFEVCIKQILDQLDTSITKNIIFVFTNSRMRHFTAGDTSLSLKTLLAKLQQESGGIIPFNSSNSFFIDNESFKYIAATQRRVKFGQEEVEVYNSSFIQSSNSVHSMIKYITTLKPARLQGIATINESKRIIQRLINPLLTLVISYEDVLHKISYYNQEVLLYKADIEELKKHMYKIEYEPVVTETTEDTMDHKFDLGLNLGFGKISWKTILKPFKFFFNISSKTKVSKNVELKEKKVLDVETITFIKDRESAERAVRDKLYEMNEKCNQYEQEIGTILTAIATFVIFIESLKLVAGEDCFKTLMTSITQEYKNDNNITLMERIKKCLQRYAIIKSRITNVNAKVVMDCMNDLFSLTHCGQIFKNIIQEKVNFDKIAFN